MELPHTKPLRILQVVSSSATSGAERHVFSLSRLLHRRGHYVEVICPPDGWLASQLRDEGVVAHEMPMKGRGWGRTLAFTMRRLRAANMDIVHSHLTRATYFGVLGGMMRRVPAVATVHIANHDQIYKRMAHGKNRLVAVSNYVKGMLHGRGIPDRFVDTVYNGTDFAEIEPIASGIHDEFGIPVDRKLVGLIGRVCPEKGHFLMLDAARDFTRAHPDSHLVFVGRVQPEFDSDLRARIDSLGLTDHVTITGNRSDVPRFLDSFAFSAMPSHKETFGIAAIEAMARKKAVIASRVGGLPEVVRHGHSGLIVDLESDAIAEAVCYLLEHHEERVEMGVRGRMLVEQKFTLGHMTDGLCQVYQRALS